MSKELINQITVSGTVVAQNLQQVNTVPILNIAIKHYEKNPFILQVKCWGRQKIEFINRYINVNDRVIVYGKLFLSKYKGKEELIIKAEKIVKTAQGGYHENGKTDDRQNITGTKRLV